MEAKEMFKIAYGGNKNAMSDKILSYGKINQTLAYELSIGSNFLSQGYTYAVSLVEQIGNELKGNNDLFKTFDNRREAEAYIKQLKREVKEKEKAIT